MTRTGELPHPGLTDQPLPGASISAAQSKPLSLRRNAIWTTVGNASYALAQWLQIAMIAHLGSSADVGRYALAMGVCAPVFLFFNLQLRQIQATDANHTHSFAEYLGLRVLSSAAALGSVFVIACLGSKSAVAITLAVGLFKCFESVSDIYQGLLQQHERMDYVGRSFILKSVLILVGFGTVYYSTHSLLLAAGISVCMQIAGLLIYDLRAAQIATSGQSAAGWLSALRTVGRPQFNQTQMFQLAGRALPLGFSMMLGSLYTNLPRFVLNKYVGVRGVGVFSAIAYLPMIGSLLVTAIGTAVAPRLSQYGRSNRPAYFVLLGKLLGVGAVLGLGGIAGSLLFGQRLLQLLYGAEYARQTDVLFWTMLAASLSYLSSGIGFGVTALGRFKAQPLIMGAAILVFFACAAVLVPKYGLAGAAMASAASTLASFLGYVGLLLLKDA
jgi:O-antigen/teichoic acid export membrane protein